MHELAVTESILEIASSHARQAEAQRVTDIYLVIGRLSSIIDDSVQFYWDMVSENTICAGAKLHFKRIPAEFKCRDCGHQFTLERELEPCPQCSSLKIQVIRGDEFRMESIEVIKDSVEAI
jgi:hydrogenase nickel incorporation protein HypA/HybF